MRYKTPVGEIDIIGLRGKTLVFVEVKHRQKQQEALYAVHKKNQSRVTKAAILYLQRNPKYDKKDIRFDVIITAPAKWPRHIKNAWHI